MPKANNLAYLHRDRGYRWAERDPDMIELCNIISKSGVSVQEICERVVKATGGAYKPSPKTLNNWLNGQTRRPSNHSMSWAGYALGYSRRWKVD